MIVEGLRHVQLKKSKSYKAITLSFNQNNSKSKQKWDSFGITYWVYNN